MRREQIYDFKVENIVLKKEDAGIDAQKTNLTDTKIDLTGFNSCSFIFKVSGIVGVSSVGFKILESNNGSDFNAVDSANLIGDDISSFTANMGDGVAKKVGYIGTKKFVSVETEVTTAESTGTVSYAVFAILGDPRQMPVA